MRASARTFAGSASPRRTQSHRQRSAGEGAETNGAVFAHLDDAGPSYFEGPRGQPRVRTGVAEIKGWLRLVAPQRRRRLDEGAVFRHQARLQALGRQLQAL